jgi:hypothetical protein
MSNPAWEKKSTDEPIWEGPRPAYDEDLSFLGEEDKTKVETILSAMVWPQVVVFRYGNSDRVVAPFVVGVSSEGNPLMRGFQLEGISRSGKAGGWRVFQVSKMENLSNHQEFFDADDFEFDRVYPWVYKVIRML